MLLTFTYLGAIIIVKQMYAAFTTKAAQPKGTMFSKAQKNLVYWTVTVMFFVIAAGFFYEIYQNHLFFLAHP